MINTCLTRHHGIDIGRLTIDLCLQGRFMEKNSLTPVEENFLQMTPRADRKSNTRMTFVDSGCIADTDPGNPVLSMTGTFLYQDDAGFLLQRFLKEEQDTPFLSVRIDRDFSDFTFHFEPTALELQESTVDWFQYAIGQNLLINSLLRLNGLLIHGAGGIVRDRGMVFAAPSGTGKSTLASLLLASGNNRLFSEERLLIHSRADKPPQLWGTPWHGSGTLANNEKTDFAALVFLRQAAETEIQPLTGSAALERLIQVASIPWYSADWTRKGLDLCENLLKETPVFELAFTPDMRAAQAVEELADVL